MLCSIIHVHLRGLWAFSLLINTMGNFSAGSVSK